MGFKKLIAAVKAHDWSKAADEMVDSDWYGKVKGRAKQLVKRMRDFASEEQKKYNKKCRHDML